MSGSPAVRIKICGVTTVEDIEHAVALGADLVGLNFYSGSPRYVDVERARLLRAVAPSGVEVVGVFVNEPLESIEAIARHVGLTMIQLHGDEGPDLAASIELPVIKALRLGDDSSPGDLDRFASVWGFLFDTPKQVLDAAPNRFGGTGEAWSWSRIQPWIDHHPRVFVAGGLRPQNVGALVKSVDGLYGIDVCSGVEREPGHKDPVRLRQFFEQARGVCRARWAVEVRIW